MSIAAAGLAAKSVGKTMQAVSITKNHAIQVVEVPVPMLGTGEILVRPCSCGICGTDLHILRHGFPGTNYPVTPGHEFAGHVVALAKALRDCVKGILSPSIQTSFAARAAGARQAGQTCACISRRSASGGRERPPNLSVFRHRTLLPSRKVSAVNWRHLIEPLACVLHAVHVIAGRQGQDRAGVRRRHHGPADGDHVGCIRRQPCRARRSGARTSGKSPEEQASSRQLIRARSDPNALTSSLKPPVSRTHWFRL